MLPEFQKKNNLRRYALSYTVLMVALLLFGWHFEKSPKFRNISESAWALNIREYSELFAKLSARMNRRLDLELQSDSGQIESPILAPQSTYFDDNLQVVVSSTHDDHQIHISTDGSVPTRRHPRAASLTAITDTTVLKVKAFDLQGRHSSTVTANYIRRPPTDISVVNLNIDPIYLYNKHVGILENPLQRKRAWERPGQLVLQSQTNDELVEINASVRIHGSASRTNRRKSLRLYVDPDDSTLTSWFDVAATSKNVIQSEWVFKHVGNSHQIFRDRLGRRLARQLDLVVGTEVSSLLYVNGAPWGVYDVHERVNPQFLSRQTGGKSFAIRNGAIFLPTKKFNPPDFDDTKDWNTVYKYIEVSDIRDSDVYKEVGELVDINEFIDYMILAIFSADIDRPSWNMDFFRENTPDSKWRFLVWDFDGGFNYRGRFTEHDTIAWHLRDKPMPQLQSVGKSDSWLKVKSTLILRRLIENDDFRASFKNRFEYLLETILSPKQLNLTFDNLLMDYAGFEEIEKQRFSDTPSTSPKSSYEDQIAQIREFLTNRTAYLQRTLETHLP